MPELDLRPLSLGEILDRTFTLYRRTGRETKAQGRRAGDSSG